MQLLTDPGLNIPESYKKYKFRSLCKFRRIKFNPDHLSLSQVTMGFGLVADWLKRKNNAPPPKKKKQKKKHRVCSVSVIFHSVWKFKVLRSRLKLWKNKCISFTCNVRLQSLKSQVCWRIVPVLLVATRVVLCVVLRPFLCHSDLTMCVESYFSLNCLSQPTCIN